MTPKPFWLAALVLALSFAAPAARAAEADHPTPPKCLAHAKALCFGHHPVCLALDTLAALFWSEEQHTAALPPPNCPDVVYGYPTLSATSSACTCVPAGAPCCNAVAMPSPMPVGTTAMPCATLPMPHPMAGCYPGTTPAGAPMPVCAEPMPVYAPCCAAPAPAPAHYVVETKLMRSKAGNAVEWADCKCMTADGAQVEMVVSEPAGALGVCVARAGKNKVGVELALECGHAGKCGKDGERMQCDCAHACRTVSVGKPTRFLLRKGGGEETWALVTVTEAPHAAPERIAKAPRPVPPAPCAVAGMTLPSGQYLQHPPQYFPPSPVFPPTRELADRQAPPMPPPFVSPCIGMVVPQPMPVPPPPMPPATRPNASPVIRAVVHEGKGWLAIQNGTSCMRCRSIVLNAGPGDAVKITAVNGSVRVRCAEMKASADGVRPAGARRIVLEGHVRMTCHHDGQPVYIKADKLEMSLEGGHVEVKPTAPAAE